MGLSLNQLNKKFSLRSDKLALFCMEYVKDKDLNATQAAITAGYSKKTAKTTASQNMTKRNVQECITFLQNKSIKRIEYTADDLKRSLIAVEEMSVADILEDDLTVKPLSEWPEVWLKNLSAVDVSTIITADQGGDDITSVIKKIKWPDKTKNRELLGKHIDIQAWREIHKIEESSTAERIKRSQKRVKDKNVG